MGISILPASFALTLLLIDGNLEKLLSSFRSPNLSAAESESKAFEPFGQEHIHYLSDFFFHLHVWLRRDFSCQLRSGSMDKAQIWMASM